jgi:methylthioribose-1-phosphate isomerase
MIAIIQGSFTSSAFDVFKKKNGNEYYVLEGRPSLESSTKSIYELNKRKIKPTLIADNMAGFLFSKNMVKEINLAYQTRDNEGALCQIGALILAVLGKKHKVPVNLYPGIRSPQRMGKQKDIFEFNGVRVAPKGIKGYVPLMESVPKKYINRIYG